MSRSSRRKNIHQSEKKVLGILAIIFGILGLLGSWVPIINNFSFILAIIAIVLGVIGLLINIKRPKTLSTVGLILSILTIIIVLVTQSFYGTAVENIGKEVEKTISSVESSMSSSQAQVDEQFKWTKADFDALVVGDSFTGFGGANYDDIVAKYGNPQSSSESSSDTYTSKYVDYNTMGGSDYKSVSLQFVQQADGSWLLALKNGFGLE